MSVAVELARKPGATLTLADDAPVRVSSGTIYPVGAALAAGWVTSSQRVEVYVDGVWLPAVIVGSQALTLTIRVNGSAAALDDVEKGIVRKVAATLGITDDEARKCVKAERK